MSQVISYQLSVTSCELTYINRKCASVLINTKRTKTFNLQLSTFNFYLYLCTRKIQMHP